MLKKPASSKVYGMASSAIVGASAVAASSAVASAGEAEHGPVPEVKGRLRKRVDRPEIDLDTNIKDCRATIQRAQQALTQARQQAKADRRKKARLIKKACHLSPADLERIAVLKRCGYSGHAEETLASSIPGAAAPSVPNGVQGTLGGAAHSSGDTPRADAPLPALGNASGSSPGALRESGDGDGDSPVGSQHDGDDDVAH